MFDVGRVEVLRGPQGTLYGKNTVGGAIKYISRGLPDEMDGFASVTAGNYSQLDVNGRLGGPIGGKDSGMRGRCRRCQSQPRRLRREHRHRQPVSDKEINAVA